MLIYIKRLFVFIWFLIGLITFSRSQCGFQPIVLYINGIEQEMSINHELNGPSVIVLKLINESKTKGCSYKFGKILIGGNGGFQNYSKAIEPPGDFSTQGAIAKIVIDSRLYQELKNRKKINQLELVIWEVWQKDESGKISRWIRWDDGRYSFRLN